MVIVDPRKLFPEQTEKVEEFLKKADTLGVEKPEGGLIEGTIPLGPAGAGAVKNVAKTKNFGFSKIVKQLLKEDDIIKAEAEVLSQRSGKSFKESINIS